MTFLERLSNVPLFSPNFSLFPLSGQNQENDINAQLILSLCLFIPNMVSINTKFQHVSIFTHIKVNDVFDDVI